MKHYRSFRKSADEFCGSFAFDTFEEGFCGFYGAIMSRVDIASRQFDHLIRFDPSALEPKPFRGEIVQFADIQNATIRQGMAVSDCENAATGFRANYARTSR